MRRGFQSTAVRQYAACAAAGIVTLGLMAAPPSPSAALPRIEVHAVQLTAVTAPATPTSVVRAAAAGQTTDDTTSTTPPNFLAFAAQILAYLDSLGFGPGPGLAAIGLSGFVVAFAATAYAWNAFANTVNPGLSALRIPRVPKFPVCFAGQTCASAASAQARPMTAASTVTTPAGRGMAKVSSTKKPTSSAASAAGKGGSKRGRN